MSLCRSLGFLANVKVVFSVVNGLATRFQPSNRQCLSLRTIGSTFVYLIHNGRSPDSLQALNNCSIIVFLPVCSSNKRDLCGENLSLLAVENPTVLLFLLTNSKQRNRYAIQNNMFSSLLH